MQNVRIKQSKNLLMIRLAVSVLGCAVKPDNEAVTVNNEK